MEKLFNTFCICIGFLGGIILKLIGGWDIPISALIILMIFDYITGVLKAYFLKRLDSTIGFWGIVKKIIILIIISTAHIISKTLDTSLPLREVVITFFISNEGLSILENASVFIPIPDRIKDVLNQIRQHDDSSSS
jgi:toxin secretion/phage lysis holin